VVSLAALLPDVMSRIPEDDRVPAERALVAPLLSACDEDLAAVLAGAPGDAFGFLLVDGIVLKETTLATRSALELLNAGDVLAPTLGEAQQYESRAVSRYLAHGPASLAVLGERFRAASRRWPEVGDDLHGRLARQTHRASAHLAMLHASRVEERIALLFEDLGERCGRMTADGVVIDISLTHDVIGRLVGAQRPTVSLALQTLAGAGSLCRADRDRWMIPRDP
jgi:CRP/FNR family transcriptional regulator, cyclic AMP receptor protein